MGGGSERELRRRLSVPAPAAGHSVNLVQEDAERPEVCGRGVSGRESCRAQRSACQADALTAGTALATPPHFWHSSSCVVGGLVSQPPSPLAPCAVSQWCNGHGCPDKLSIMAVRSVQSLPYRFYTSAKRRATAEYALSQLVREPP